MQFWTWLSSTIKPSYTCSQCFLFYKQLGFVNIFTSITLCHVRGCCFCAISEPCIQSTAEIPFGELRFMASPLRPTCLGHFHENIFETNIDLLVIEMYDKQPGSSILPRTGPIFPGQVHAAQLDPIRQCSIARNALQHSLMKINKEYQKEFLAKVPRERTFWILNEFMNSDVQVEFFSEETTFKCISHSYLLKFHKAMLKYTKLELSSSKKKLPHTR